MTACLICGAETRFADRYVFRVLLEAAYDGRDCCAGCVLCAHCAERLMAKLLVSPKMDDLKRIYEALL
jgi:hypothetical protein